MHRECPEWRSRSGPGWRARFPRRVPGRSTRRGVRPFRCCPRAEPTAPAARSACSPSAGGAGSALCRPSAGLRCRVRQASRSRCGCADMELVMRPSLVCRVATMSSVYAFAAGTSGANACRGTVRKACSTAVVRMWPTEMSWSAGSWRRALVSSSSVAGVVTAGLSVGPVMRGPRRWLRRGSGCRRWVRTGRPVRRTWRRTAPGRRRVRRECRVR